ncbi:SRPBCC domain-containing protein [Kitasatospora sp. YST-16]|uniref:CoxG family protein n=1 Tax=Kitasatospora sp. YST-16 TaxID=2998080 RepID=UPI002284EA85|nr:SRPBCC domain-containing protein [Kitasatospora sp. YST-16]WAL72828.1 SRPBCC domain-containing protein [Kitasatospora sp. YST-16]WNW38878.1 SRPBCC domain-containing protein [Streptomyces sp. Li-HN-5-13]
MEHEVVVPVPAEVVREALLDRELLARCVPGLSAVASASAPGGADSRLRIRVAGSTITFAGRLTVGDWQDGALAVRLSGEEIRGAAPVAAGLRITLAERTGETAIRFATELTAAGRLAGFEAEALEATGRRLIDRAVAALVAEVSEPADRDGEEADDDPTDGATVVFLDERERGQDLDDDLSDLISFDDADDLPAPVPAAPRPEPGYDQEGAPVRRSIVGRSAEEVDHAPPHGRYAPAPPAHSARARAASRWGGSEPTLLPGAHGERSALPWMIGGGVALIGGAVVLVRALRRR